MNKTVVLNSWRLDDLVTLEEIIKIESICSEMINLFGYIKISDKLEKIRDLSISPIDLEHSLVL